MAPPQPDIDVMTPKRPSTGCRQGAGKGGPESGLSDTPKSTQAVPVAISSCPGSVTPLPIEAQYWSWAPV